MTFFVTGLDGEMEEGPSRSLLVDLVAQLDRATKEHSDVAIQDESGWSLTAFSGGRLVWENVEEDHGTWHMLGLRREEVLNLFISLSRAEIDEIESCPWCPGY